MPARQGDAHGFGDSFRRWMVTMALGLTMLLATGGTGLAVPPPPPNPSDSEIDSSQNTANTRAGEVGQLTNQLAEAESQLSELQDDVELKMEQANKALVDMQTAQDAAGQARRDAAAARTESDAAAGAVESARTSLDRFVAGSYQQGSTIGSMSAYLDSKSPKNLLARAQLLDAVGGSRLDALRGMQRAQTGKANKDAAARQALELAQQKQAEAEQAKGNADAAHTAAQRAQDSQADRAGALQTNVSTAQQRLYGAQAAVGGLQGQRQRYTQWQAQKEADEQARARRAAESAASSGSGHSSGNGSDSSSNNGVSSPSKRPTKSQGSAGSSVEAAVARAKSQLGMPYAWGGGNGSGPTRGIRDGGVADRYGDYRKIGFDCSGLMIYAFSGVKSLTHYSGYQYTAGRRVPISQMRRGDMLFWGSGSSSIHHVAMYLGDGQMIEAPQSGSTVRITSVRYGGIMPYATRLIG